MTKKQKGNNKSKNKDGKCFQYALTVALNYEQIKDHPERISKIKPLLINTTGKRQIFHRIVKIGKNLSQTINQLLSIFCMCLIILKK